MALGYLIDPAFQSVNENGRPLVGGHIEVFYHNNHLPYITKADFEGTNNPFKVPLNSKGMAVIIADDTNAYDVFCYDAFNTLFWSRENITTAGQLLNGRFLIPDSRYLKFTDFNGDVVVSLCDNLQSFLANGGYTP